MTALASLNRSFFSMRIDGHAVSDGEIDVNDLAPALLSMGELLQASNDVINSEGSQLSVNVKATTRGCFDIDFAAAQTIIESTKTLFDFAKENSEGIDAANSLVDLIFKVTAGLASVGGGLFALLIWLSGRKPDKKEKDSNGDIILFIGDQTFITNPKVLNLAENLAVREKAGKVVSLLERDGIDKISFYQEKQENSVSVEAKDIPSFKVPEFDEKEIDRNSRKMVLQISSLSFKEDNKWRLTDGGEPFFATITDSDFLIKIASSQISFSKNDYLTCMVTETQLITAQGLKKERVITKVIEHKEAMKQLKLI